MAAVDSAADAAPQQGCKVKLAACKVANQHELVVAQSIRGTPWAGRLYGKLACHPLLPVVVAIFL